MTHAIRHSSALPLPRPQAGQENCVQSPALPLVLLLALLRLLALLARHHPALAARLGASFPLRRPRSSWMHQSWGAAEDPDSIDPVEAIGLARAIARLLYVFGPRPRRGMRALPSTRPIPRRTPPIRPPPALVVPAHPRKSPGFPGAFARPKYYDNETKITPLRPRRHAASVRPMRNPATSPRSRFWYRWYYTPAV